MNVRMIMVRFPVTLITYIRNKKTKIRTSSCGSSVNPSKMTVVMPVWFLITSFDVLYDLHVTKSKKSYPNRWKEIISKKRKKLEKWERETREKMDIIKSWFLERMSNIDKLLLWLVWKKREKVKFISNVRYDIIAVYAYIKTEKYHVSTK